MFPKNLFNSPDDLVKVVTEIMTGKSKKEALDPVDAKALKGSHADRKDKDIDNDGDVDSSDEYLHNRRKTVKKAMKEATKVKENDDNDDDDMEDDEDEMTSAQKNDMDGDGKNDKKKKKKKNDELSDKPDKIDTKPSMDDARTMMAKEEVDLGALDELSTHKLLDYAKKAAADAEKWRAKYKKTGAATDKLGRTHMDIHRDVGKEWAQELIKKRHGTYHPSDKMVALDRRKKITKALKEKTVCEMCGKAHEGSCGMKEEVDLDEGLAKHIIRGDNYVGVPDRVVALAKQKVKKMNISTVDDHSKAMHKALSDLGWQMTVSGKYVREEVELDEEPKTLKLAQDSAVRNAVSKIHSLMKVRKISPSQAYAEWEKGTTFGLKLKTQVRNSLSSLHEMSDVQMKKREEIVKGMKKNSGDLKKRYGDRWKDVMYATATKQAMKEEVEIDEARGRPKKEDDVSSDSNFVMQMRKAISLNGNKVNFLDGSSSQVSSRDAQQFMIAYNKQKSSIDKGRLMRSAHKSLKHFKMALQGKIEKPKNPLDLD